MKLDGVQLRVLGSLIEKEIVTPEAYPLSLAGLTAACNQRSSREPVMELDEDEVRQALHSLEELGLTAVVRESRVPKFEHRARTVLDLRRDETSLLCVLLLRGPQTPGELRARTDRLYSFDGLDAVESTLTRLSAAPPAPGNSPAAGKMRPLVAVLLRQPGSREARYIHLLGAAVESAAVVGSGRSGTNAPAVAEPNFADRIANLEAEIAQLRSVVDAMRVQLAELEARHGQASED